MQEKRRRRKQKQPGDRVKPIRKHRHPAKEKDYPGPWIKTLRGSWEGQDAYVVGAGWSLQGFKWDLLKGKNTIVLNDAVFAVPEPSIHLYADTAIAKRYNKHPYHPDTRIVTQGGSRDKQKKVGFKYPGQVILFRNRGKLDTLSADDNYLYVSRTVATGGCTLAWKLGARRVFLLGVDACRPANHDAYYYDGSWKKKEGSVRGKQQRGDQVELEVRHVKWNENMRSLKEFFTSQSPSVYSGSWPGSSIYNLSAISTIDVWEKVPAAIVFEEDPWLK